MASVASVDKTLSRVSAWMSSVAFAGVLALAFLPSRAGAPTRVQSVAPVVPPTAAAPAVNAPPAKAAQAKPPAVPVIAAAAPSSTALTPPPVARAFGYATCRWHRNAGRGAAPAS